MTATATPGAVPVTHRTGTAILGSGRLLRLELRHNAMLWLLPLVGALFWFNGYREIMALPPMWNLRAMTLQNRLLLDLAIPVTSASAWMGSREGRRNMTELVVGTARPRWARQLATWSATTVWAEVGGPPGVRGRSAVVAGRGQPGGHPGADRRRVRRRGLVPQPVRHPAGHRRGVLRAGVRHAGSIG